MKNFFYKITLGAFLLCLAVMSKADIYIDILGGGEQAEPIAILPFDVQTKNPLKYELHKIVSNDLSRSGLFALINISQESVPDFTTIGYKFYRKLGVENILTAEIRDGEKGRYKIKITLHDILLKKKRWDYVWSFSSSQIRQAAHQISDLIFKDIIGKESAFSSHLAFVIAQKNAKKRRSYQLKISDTDGYNAKTILKSTAPILSPTWSPDGKKLAYVSFENGRSEIFVHHIWKGEREVVASFKGINSSPAWSPDGKSLLMTLSSQGNSEIYLMHLDSKKVFRLTNHPSIDTEAMFSADGKYIFFTSGRGGSPQIYRANISNYQSHPRLSQLVRITKKGSYNAGASISQDGKYLALIHSEGKKRSSSTAQDSKALASSPAEDKKLNVTLYDIENEDFYPITDTFLDDSPSLSPGANMIVYSSVDATSQAGQLIIMDLRARSKIRLRITNGEVKDPAWGPAKKTAK